MSRIVLFHLDPLDDLDEMVCSRLSLYHELATELSRHRYRCAIYGRPRHLKALRQMAEDRYKLIPSRLPEVDFGRYGEYHARAYVNNLPDELQDLLDAEYSRLGIDPDVIVTNTPSAGIRSVWKTNLILHYEQGFFSRKPFPLIHQVDPWGYYHKSLLSAVPILGLPVDQANTQGLLNFRREILDSLNLSESVIGSDDCIYFPLQSSDSWPVRIENPTLDRFEMLRNLRRRYPNKLIRVSEKPSSPLASEERARLLTVEGVELIDNVDSNGAGAAMVMRSAAIFTSSPSMSLQAIFWGNRLVTPYACSMQAWGKDPSIDNLATYIAMFNFQKPSTFVERLNTYRTLWHRYYVS